MSKAEYIDLSSDLHIELIMLASYHYVQAFSSNAAFSESLYDYSRYFDVQGYNAVKSKLSGWLHDTTSETASLIVIKKSRPWYQGLQKAFDRESIRLNTKVNLLSTENQQLKHHISQLKTLAQQQETYYKNITKDIESYRSDSFFREQKIAEQIETLSHLKKKHTRGNLATYAMLFIISCASLYGLYLHQPQKASLINKSPLKQPLPEKERQQSLTDTGT